MNSSEDKSVTLPQGRVTYRDVGAGPTIVFVHGLFLNGTIWDKTVERLTSHRRCIVPELPLGAHKNTAQQRGRPVIDRGLPSSSQTFWKNWISMT